MVATCSPERTHPQAPTMSKSPRTSSPLARRKKAFTQPLARSKITTSAYESFGRTSSEKIPRTGVGPARGVRLKSEVMASP
ncbi:hypothetical protein BGZ60DRAFT_138160 [Tricladium varicosporioides]|nr:hypothetical protein BGZ60DRAFT_138160 [Hymenoscyphus varicosporioides]